MHRRTSERDRIARLSPLRTPPFREADRDGGLERAWVRRLCGSCLRAAGGELELASDHSYSRVAGHTREIGAWSIWSNVGRACLMLSPGEHSDYGYVLELRDDGGVNLNGAPYELTASSAASAADTSIAAISRASPGVRRA